MRFEDIEKQFGKYKNKKLTRTHAIRIYCKELCCAGDNVSWRECNFISCPLWRFRKGTELKVNLGSFGVRDKITTKKEKSKKNVGKIDYFLEKNPITDSKGDDKNGNT